MRNANGWLLGVALGVATAIGAGHMAAEKPAAAADKKEVRDHWHYHDGHWSYWNEPDKRWYYTDGANWYYNDSDAWKVYRFDKQFGRDGFERGDYKTPGEDAKIEVPKHGVYRQR